MKGFPFSMGIKDLKRIMGAPSFCCQLYVWCGECANTSASMLWSGVSCDALCFSLPICPAVSGDSVFPEGPMHLNSYFKPVDTHTPTHQTHTCTYTHRDPSTFQETVFFLRYSTDGLEFRF